MPRYLPFASLATLPAPGLGATATPTRNLPVGVSSFFAAASSACAGAPASANDASSAIIHFMFISPPVEFLAVADIRLPDPRR
jgi:hypothetical protein